jgi:hypothetical protein
MQKEGQRFKMDSTSASESDLRKICSFISIKEILKGRIAICSGGHGGVDYRDNLELKDILPANICPCSKKYLADNPLERFYINPQPIISCDYCNRNRKD